MKFQSINPYNKQILYTFEEQSKTEVAAIIEQANQAFQTWRQKSFSDRALIIKRAGEILLDQAEKYAKTISLEMGKPIAEARAEIKKCAWVCNYYAENAENFLNPESIVTDAEESYVTHEPMGVLLAIMPWNFPFWQVFRWAVPSLMAGNVGLLKHAPNVFRSALDIEDIFREAGCEKGVFQNLVIHHERIAQVIENAHIKAISLTGSERAGASVAMLAGKNIKKTLLELGGSNAFIVCEDADLDLAATIGVKARMLNAGQSCIAAKRFLVMEKVYDAFLDKFTEAMKRLKSGDPLNEDTEVGPLARVDLAEQLSKQVEASIQAGAKLVLGGKQNGAYYEPSILTEVTEDMPVFQEETFGPVAPMLKVKTEEEAFEIAERTKFGLGISLFTKDISKAKGYITRVSDGAFFINDLVKSDPRLPFGGTKSSGYGRELSKDGILEFVNRKTVYIKH